MVPPKKAAELTSLQTLLRAHAVPFLPVAAGKRGDPDLIIISPSPVAVWLRRSDMARPLTDRQHAQISRTASLGWQTLIAFGALDTMRELARLRVIAC